MGPLILGALLYYINNLLNKLSKENKTVFFLGDFNIALLNYDQHSVANVFLDSISSHMFVPHFVQPTRIRNNSNTLIYNIYSNMITPIGPSPPISHCSGYFSNPPFTKLNTFERDWSKFDQENFILD